MKVEKLRNWAHGLLGPECEEVSFLEMALTTIEQQRNRIAELEKTIQYQADAHALELRDYDANLEQRVKERTDELSGNITGWKWLYDENCEQATAVMQYSVSPFIGTMNINKDARETLLLLIKNMMEIFLKDQGR